jgi:hypothetical protein
LTAKGLFRATTLSMAVAIAACGSTPVSPTAPTAAAASDQWFSIITPRGVASRTFTAAQPGTVTATLVASSAPLSLGIGVPGGAGIGCRLAASVGPDQSTLSTAVEAGTYCVAVFDEMVPPDPISFTVTIDHP